MRDMNQEIIEKWECLKILVHSLEIDMLKCSRGVTAAGIRARKGLRLLKAEAHELLKMTIEENKKEK